MGPFEEYATKIKTDRDEDPNKDNQEYLIENIKKYDTSGTIAGLSVRNNNIIRRIFKFLKIAIILLSLLEIKILLAKNSFSSKMFYLLSNFFSYLVVYLLDIRNSMTQECNEFLSIVFSNVSKFYEINLVYINHLLTDKEFQEVKNKLDDELIKLAQEYDQDEIDDTEKVLKKENKNVRNKR